MDQIVAEKLENCTYCARLSIYLRRFGCVCDQKHKESHFWGRGAALWTVCVKKNAVFRSFLYSEIRFLFEMVPKTHQNVPGRDFKWCQSIQREKLDLE